MSEKSIELFNEVMRIRFACKRYSDTPILPPEIHQILEAGRLSPTSFGLEGWHFHVVASEALRTQLTKACFDQESVETAPVSVIITAKTATAYEPYGQFVRERGQRFPGTLQEFINDYIGYYQFLKESQRLDCWSRSQCYIAAANMMQAAATIGIQSCAIEGFDETKVAPIINLDTTLWQVALVIPFGYPDEPIREKIRVPFDAITTFH